MFHFVVKNMYQMVVQMVVMVEKEGPACHLGTESCFNDAVYLNPAYNQFSMDNLFEMLEGRKKNMPEGSYTTYLFEKGIDKILKKIGEESFPLHSERFCPDEKALVIAPKLFLEYILFGCWSADKLF